jgi:hypothetical protein
LKKRKEGRKGGREEGRKERRKEGSKEGRKEEEIIYKKLFVCSNIIGHGSHAKGRAHTGGIGKGRKPKT